MITIKNGDTSTEVEGNKNGYVEVCRHVANKIHPILNIEMNIPHDAEHSGWVAICDAEEDCEPEDYVRWPMEKLIATEPSLKELLQDSSDLPMIVRDNVNSSWEVL